MDAKTRASLCIILFLLPVTVQSQEPSSIYHVAYFENKNGVRRKSVPDYLQNLSLLNEPLRLQGSDLPPLDFQKNIEWKVIGKIKQGTVKLVLQAEEVLLPLNPQETALNAILQKEEIQKISLKGEGKIWLKADSGEVIGEEFFISGEVVRGNREERLQMEWAKCLLF